MRLKSQCTKKSNIALGVYIDQQMIAVSIVDDGTGDSTHTKNVRLLTEIDERLNAIVLRDLPTRIVSIRELIARLDAPLAQVAIEARIVTASDNLNHQLGVQWRADVNSADKQNDVDSAAADMTSLIATTTLAVGAPASTLTLGVLRPGVAVDAELSYLAEKG